MLFQLRNCFHLIKLTQVKTSFVALNLQYRIANVKEVTITKEDEPSHGGGLHHHIEVPPSPRESWQGGTITMEVTTMELLGLHQISWCIR